MVAAMACSRPKTDPAPAASASAVGSASTSRALLLKKPEHGIQLETPEFVVKAGEERQWCYYFKLPSDIDLEIVRFEIRYLAGSHHMNLFQTDKEAPDHDEECFKKMPFT